MRAIVLTVFLFLVGTAAFADDPCQVLGKPGAFTPGGLGPSGSCGGNASVVDAELLARIINNQQAEIAALKAAIDGLTKAVASLEATSKNLVVADKKFQTDTVNSTIAAIDKVPASLAAEKSLQGVLVAAIKDKLLKDPTFLEAVKKTQ